MSLVRVRKNQLASVVVRRIVRRRAHECDPCRIEARVRTRRRAPGWGCPVHPSTGECPRIRLRIDPLGCGRCGGRMVVRAVVKIWDTARKLLGVLRPMRQLVLPGDRARRAFVVIVAPTSDAGAPASAEVCPRQGVRERDTMRTLLLACRCSLGWGSSRRQEDAVRRAAP